MYVPTRIYMYVYVYKRLHTYVSTNECVCEFSTFKLKFCDNVIHTYIHTHMYVYKHIYACVFVLVRFSLSVI